MRPSRPDSSYLLVRYQSPKPVGRERKGSRSQFSPSRMCITLSISHIRSPWGLLLTPCLQFSGVGGCWVLVMVLGTLLNFFSTGLCFRLGGRFMLSRHNPRSVVAQRVTSLGRLWGWISLLQPYCTQAGGAVTSSAESCNSICLLVCRDGKWFVDISSAFRKISLVFWEQDLRLNEAE